MLMIYLDCFPPIDQAEKFKKYLSSKHPNINFLLEKENDSRLSFLAIYFFVEKETLSLTFTRKRPLVVFILISRTSYPNLQNRLN